MKISIYENLFYVFFFFFLLLLAISISFFILGYTEPRYWIFIAFMSSSVKKRFLFIVVIVAGCCCCCHFFFLFLVVRSCISLEWHRFEFFMQIEGWWDKNKLYNCRWNGRAAAATITPKKSCDPEKKSKKRASKSIFYISQCDRECFVTVEKENGER